MLRETHLRNGGRKIKVLHIISSLEVGGAEMMLFKLLSSSDRARFDSMVLSLAGIGPVGLKIQGLGVPVESLGMSSSVPNPLILMKLARRIGEVRPDVIQTWMPHSDLLGGLAARWAGVGRVCWNIRHSDLDPKTIKRRTIMVVKLCARLSNRVPHRIVCCSEVAARVHEKLGYDARKIVTIPNGFNLDQYKVDPDSRVSVRRELNLPPETPLIGHIGRYRAMKDHPSFLAAAGILHAHRTDVHFVLVGDGVGEGNAELARYVQESGASSRIHLLGPRDDVPRIAGALDVMTSSSAYGEGFPNVVGEAMACGVPCVVTDVGDSAFLVGETGRVIPPRDPRALASAWRELMDMPAEERRRLGRAARERMETHFNLPVIAGRYERLYEEAAKLCAV
jgi:glycosyltransferase involved in cell wall biosynthesis